jgi:hypothetical protein
LQVGVGTALSLDQIEQPLIRNVSIGLWREFA